MVIRILTGKEVAGSVRYNERKVAEGEAERIQIVNYPDPNIAEKYGQFRLQLLEQQARLNPAVTKPSLHLAIAFHPTELITNDRMRQIGSEVMTRAGYGQQPYLMYRHNDTRHPHLHIVSVSIDADGRKISDAFIQRRLNQIRKEIEKRHGLIQAEHIGQQQEAIRAREGAEGQEQKEQQRIGAIVGKAIDTFTFGSLDSFSWYLRSQDVLMKVAAGRSKAGVTFQVIEKSGKLTRPVTASKLTCKPTSDRLEALFATQAERHAKGCQNMTATVHERLSRYECLTETDYKTTLRKAGIQVSDRGGVYLYVQLRAGVLGQENELDPTLCRQALLTRFAQSTIRKPDEETKVVGRLMLNSITELPARPVQPPPTNLKSTLKERPQVKFPLEQPQPEPPVADRSSASIRTVETLTEPMTQSVKLGSEGTGQRLPLMDGQKKQKKNRSKKGPRM